MALLVRLIAPVRLWKCHRLHRLMWHLPKLKMWLQPKHSDQSLDQAPTEAATKQAKIDIKIDGYLSYFDYDSAVLSQQTLSGLLFVADYLKSNPAVQILIEGHCDERGTRDYNIALGHKRAEAVRKQLARMGVDPQRITTKSFGKERPAMRGASPEAWAKNRRTIIRIRGE